MVTAQLLNRQLQESARRSVPIWRAVGLSRNSVRALIAAPAAVAALVGALIATGAAIVLSGRFPIGPARAAETHRGLSVNVAIVLGERSPSECLS